MKPSLKRVIASVFLFGVLGLFFNGQCTSTSSQNQTIESDGTIALTSPSPHATITPTPTPNSNNAPKPKLDVLFAVKTVGKLGSQVTQYNQKILEFMNRLKQDGWDYRFTLVPLDTESYSITQIVASDYPAIQNETLPKAIYRSPETFTAYLNPKDEIKSVGSYAEGFVYLYTYLGYTAVLRPTARLAIILLSNDDHDDTFGSFQSTSGWEWDFQNWKKSILSFKAYDASLVQLFSIVSLSNSSQCPTGSIPGTRYQRMATELGGQSYDLCTSQASATFTAIADLIKAKK